MATTNRPSPATKNAALAVRDLGTPRKVASASIVVASGVVDLLERASASSASIAGATVGAICWFAA